MSKEGRRARESGGVQWRVQEWSTAAEQAVRSEKWSSEQGAESVSTN